MSEKADIEKLALLARIKLSAEEKEKLQKEFEAILDYVSQLKTADVSGVEDSEVGNTSGQFNVVREDENPYETGKFTEDLMRETPATENGYVKVRKIL